MPPKRLTAPGPALYAASASAVSPLKASSCCLRYLAPPLRFWTGSSTLVTPRPAAVAGISCVRPRAPAGEPASGLKPDSCLTRPASSAGAMPLALAAAVISAAYGVPAGSSEAPVGAAVGVAGAAEASEAKFVLAVVPCAVASADEKLVLVDGCWTGAGTIPAPSIDWIWLMRLMAASMLMRRRLP